MSPESVHEVAARQHAIHLQKVADDQAKRDALESEIFERITKFFERNPEKTPTVALLVDRLRGKYLKADIQIVVSKMSDAGMLERIYPKPHTLGQKTLRYRHVG